MDFLQGKRLLATPGDEESLQQDRTAPMPTLSPQKGPTMTKGANSPQQHVFKKRRKVQDHFILRPLKDSNSMGLAMMSTSLTRNDDKDVVNYSSATASTLRKSKSDVFRRLSSKPKADQVDPSTVDSDSIKETTKLLLELPVPISRPGTPNMVALEKSLSNAFWSRHFPLEDSAEKSNSQISLDEDIRAYCQRGPVASISRKIGRIWLTNMLRAYDLPQTDPPPGIAQADQHLQEIISRARGHFLTWREDNESEFLTALMDALAHDILDACTNEFAPTVASYYRELLTNLPALLQERDEKVRRAGEAMAILSEENKALAREKQVLMREKESVQIHINELSGRIRDQSEKIQDMEYVMRDAVAAELAATSTVKQLEISVREIQHALDTKTQAMEQHIEELAESKERPATRGVVCSCYLHNMTDVTQTTRERDESFEKQKEWAQKASALANENIRLKDKTSDLQVEQQVLLLRLGAANISNDKMTQNSRKFSIDAVKETPESSSLRSRVEELQDQNYSFTIKTSDLEKRVLLLQNESSHKDQLLKRLDTSLLAANEKKASLLEKQEVLTAQKETLKQRLNILQGPHVQAIDELKQQINNLQEDKLNILEDFKRVCLERDVALDDLSKAKRKLAMFNNLVVKISHEMKQLHQEQASLHKISTLQLHGFRKQINSVATSVKSTISGLETREADLMKDILDMQRGAVSGDPIVRFMLQSFQKQLVLIKEAWQRLRIESQTQIATLAHLHAEKIHHVQQLCGRIHDLFMHKAKQKKQHVISIPSATATKAVPEKPHTKRATSMTNAMTQTNSQKEEIQQIEELTQILMPVLQHVETKLMAVMDKVEAQKYTLLAAYEREAERLNGNVEKAGQARQPTPSEVDERPQTPEAIVHMRQKLMELFGNDSHLALHVGDLYDMLHSNLDVLEASLNNSPVIFSEHYRGQGQDIVAVEISQALNLSPMSPLKPQHQLSSRKLFKPSKTSTRTLFALSADDLPSEVTENLPITPPAGSMVSTLNLEVKDGELEGLPVEVRKRVKTAVLKLAASALFHEDASIQDVASLFMTSDPDVDLSAHGLHDIREDQYEQSLGPAFSLAQHEMKGLPSASFNLKQNEQRNDAAAASLASSKLPSKPTVTKIVTRLTQLVGDDINTDDKLKKSGVRHTKIWLIKQIRSIYHDKYIAESREHASLRVVMAFPEFIIHWSFLKFGVRELVAKNMHSILDCTNEWKDNTPEIALFSAFLAETGQQGYGKSDLSLFLHARHLIVQCTGDMRQFEEDNLPLLSSSQAIKITNQVFQTIAHSHRGAVQTKLKALLKPHDELFKETAPTDQFDLVPLKLNVPCFEFTGLPEAPVTPGDAFPESKPKKATPGHITDPRLIVDGFLENPPATPEEKWINAHQLLHFCVVEFREERRRFFTDMQAYVACMKVKEDLSKATFGSMLSTLFEWTPTIAELIFEEASQVSSKRTTQSDGTIVVDCHHLMCFTLQYYTNLFALARFTDGLSVDQTEEQNKHDDFVTAAPRFRHRETSRMCK
ncbi:hypothetical protein AeMF1_016013 [Aphanomyces euteiches]|nr:hypothetical protein AeMF1_016013 [Aphanomyces euteiches]